MTRPERVELILIPVAGALVLLLPDLLPGNPDSGSLVLVLASLLLFQGLVRDLWLLSQTTGTDRKGASRTGRFICLESSIGMTGIIAGGLLVGGGTGGPVSISAAGWSLAVMLVLGVGFLVKDYVLQMGPWRIRRDRDHMNIIFSWLGQGDPGKQSSRKFD